MLDSTNIVALVGGGDDPYIQLDNVGIWNDYQVNLFLSLMIIMLYSNIIYILFFISIFFH